MQRLDRAKRCANGTSIENVGQCDTRFGTRQERHIGSQKARAALRNARRTSVATGPQLDRLRPPGISRTRTWRRLRQRASYARYAADAHRSNGHSSVHDRQPNCRRNATAVAPPSRIPIADIRREPFFIVSGWGWVSTNWPFSLVSQTLQSLKSAFRRRIDGQRWSCETCYHGHSPGPQDAARFHVGRGSY